MVKRWVKRCSSPWLAPCFTFVHLDRISCWVWEFVHGFKPHLRKATLWRSSESFDIWLIPQTLAYGTQEEPTATFWAIQTQIGRETEWIGSPPPEGANFLVAIWWVGLLRSKVVCLSRPPKWSMWPPVVVVLNFYRWGKLWRITVSLMMKCLFGVTMKVPSRSLSTRCNTSRRSILRFDITSSGITLDEERPSSSMSTLMITLQIFSRSSWMKQDFAS